MGGGGGSQTWFNPIGIGLKMKTKERFKRMGQTGIDPIGLAGINKGSQLDAEGDEQPQQSSPSEDLNAAKEAAAQRAKEAQNKRRLAMARSKTVYSSPLGVSAQAQTANKTLLGN